jgi:mono/diheme cytochrome c family protein
VKFECFKCHAVKGEEFPGVAKTATDVGPDLTGMGGHHLAEYFAESIMNPNAVILTDEKGYMGQDGKSVMPDYSQSMTVRELIDVVAYLKSLKEGDMDHMKMGSGPAKKAPTKMPGDSGHGAMGK